MTRFFLQEEEKNQRLQNEVIRGHRLTTMNDQITSPPPQFGRNGTLPPLDSGEMNGITGVRVIYTVVISLPLQLLTF